MKSQARKVAVVVGATGNLGRSVCSALRTRGFDLHETWLKKDHPDVRDEHAFQDLPECIHAAIYLAGVNRVLPAEQVTTSIWDEVLDVNLKYAFIFAQKALPGMKAAGKASFITISSIMTTHPYPGRAPYAAAKAGLEALTKSLAVEWGKFGIATHCIRLGHLEGLMKTTRTDPSLLDAVRRTSALGTQINAAQVASFIANLVTDCQGMTSGETIEIDPAYVINRWPI